MNLFYYISSRNHINFNLNTFYNRKINIIYFFTTFYLILCPYISLEISQLLFIFFEAIFIFYFKGIFCNYTVNIIGNGINIYLYLHLLNQYSDEQYYVKNNIKVFKISLMYCWQIVPILYNNIIYFNLSFFFIYYNSIKYIYKFIILNIIYLSLSNKISSLVTTEIITIKIFNIYTLVKTLNKKYLYKKNYIEILLSLSILERIVQNINKIYISVAIKNINNRYLLFKNTVNYIYKFNFYLSRYQNNLNIIFYLRNIKNIINTKKCI